MTVADDIIAWMRHPDTWFPYEQILGSWDAGLGNIRRPKPGPDGADCTSVIQYGFLIHGGPDPGYYTGDMRTRGRLVADSTRGNFDAIGKCDVLLMRWPSGTWHAELATGEGNCIGHPGPGWGPYEKNLRAYLSGAAYWEARRHDSIHTNPSGGKTVAKPNTETPHDPEEEEEMMKGCSYKRTSDNTIVHMLFNEVSGFYQEFHAGVGKQGMGAGYNNPIAQNWKTGSWPTITEAHAKSIKENLIKVRQGK